MDSQKSHDYMNSLSGEPGLTIEVTTSVERAVAEAEIILMATWRVSHFLSQACFGRART
jgi:ornithine cyclodeaminase/alanine dehydrogenase-like protein (mu-crystallin family)